MKFIFAGPTLYGTHLQSCADYQLRPPARQGDIYRAVQDGASVIGLIDGVFEHVPSVWHKEILHGLSLGVHILGAASMGALRAAECRAFGMVGIGEIYEDCASGRRTADADVAQSHGPAEIGFLPLSEPLVNVQATLAACLALSLVSDEERGRLWAAAESIFFKDRTYRRIVEKCAFDDDRAFPILTALQANKINLKLRDARLLIDAVVAAGAGRTAPQDDWKSHETQFWKKTFRPEN